MVIDHCSQPIATFRFRLIGWLIFTLFAVSNFGVISAEAAEGQPLTLGEVIATVIDEATVTAVVAGPVTKIHVAEGEAVDAGDVLARLDDRTAKLSQSLTAGALTIAQQQAADSLNVDAARGRVQQEEQLAQEHETQRELNRRKAANDLRVQAARKAEGVAKNELKRAVAAREAFADAVSESEIEGLRLAFERRQLETLQAVFDRQMDQLTVDVDDAVAKSFRLRVRAAELALEQAEAERRIDELKVQLKRRELDLANLRVQQHELRSPIAGTVVEVNRRLGDWVDPGQQLARVIRTDRLRAEGFLPAAKLKRVLESKQIRLKFQGADGGVVVCLPTETFVSPEMDPITGESRFWIEFENQGNRVRPGSRGSLLLLSGGDQP